MGQVFGAGTSSLARWRIYELWPVGCDSSYSLQHHGGLVQPDEPRQSGMANSDGWVLVNMHTKIMVKQWQNTSCRPPLHSWRTAVRPPCSRTLVPWKVWHLGTILDGFVLCTVLTVFYFAGSITSNIPHTGHCGRFCPLPRHLWNGHVPRHV